MTNKKPNNYAFIDSQNLNLGVRSLGWQVDYQKFRLYLQNKYNVTRAFMFIGRVSNNQKLYKKLRNSGFELVFKSTIHYYERGRLTTKGNVDAELVLHAAAIEFNNYDKAVIVSGDGDFTCLVKYLLEEHKLGAILAPNERYSSLFGPYDRYVYILNDIRRHIEYHKNQKTSSS